MTRNKRKFNKSVEAVACNNARKREIRDLYNRLRKKYRPQVVDKFFRDNYFLQPRTVEMFVKDSDNHPVDVDNASLIYKTAIKENFYL